MFSVLWEVLNVKANYQRGQWSELFIFLISIFSLPKLYMGEASSGWMYQNMLNFVFTLMKFEVWRNKADIRTLKKHQEIRITLVV